MRNTRPTRFKIHWATWGPPMEASEWRVEGAQEKSSQGGTMVRNGGTVVECEEIVLSPRRPERLLESLLATCCGTVRLPSDLSLII